MLEYLEEVADALAGMYVVTETDDNKLKIEKDRDNLTFYISKGSNEETGELDAFVLNDGTKNSYFDNLDEIIDLLINTYELDPGDEARPSIRRESKLKTEAIYLVTPNEGDSKIIDLDEIEKAVSEITDTVKSNGNDATSFAIEEAENEQPSDVNVNSDENDIEVVDISEEPEQFEIVDTLDIEPDANSTLLDAASISGSDITSDVQADGIVEIVDETIVNGPMFTLAEQLMSAYFTVSSLHRNLTGKEWFEGHETLDNYAKELNLIIDEVIEQNIALGGIEPSVQQAITAFPTEAICGRDKVESYRIVRSLFNSIITLMEECKSGIPADVISKIEESQNFFRKEAEYKLARTMFGESKLMTVEEMKKERILEGKLAQVKVDAKKDALDTGDDQYIYQDGEEVYYTDESPKKNPKLFDRVTLIGKFITDMKDGKMVVNYYTEGQEVETREISKFKRRLNEVKSTDHEWIMANWLVDNYNKERLEDKSDLYDLIIHHARYDSFHDAEGNEVSLSSDVHEDEDGQWDTNLDVDKVMSYIKQIYANTSVNESKIGDVEIQDSMDYVGTNDNPELEEIAGDKISFEQFKKEHKDEIDSSYKNTYGDEINKDLYNALADYMYNDSITGNVQTKENHTDIIDETNANKELVNDTKNESKSEFLDKENKKEEYDMMIFEFIQSCDKEEALGWLNKIINNPDILKQFKRDFPEKDKELIRSIAKKWQNNL